MHPVLFQINHFSIADFFILISVYAAVSSIILFILYKIGRWNKEYIVSAVLYSFPVILAGIMLAKSGHFMFRSYSFMYSLAFIAALFMIYFYSEKYELDQEKTLYTALIIAVFGILGARIYYVLNNIESYNFITALTFWKGGFNFPGGLVLATAASMLYLIVKKQRVLKYTDFLFWSFSLAQSIAHQGCFLNGCCYGTPTNLPWGVHFPDTGFYTGPATAIHPIQVYKTLSYLTFFLLGRYMLKHKQFDGQVTAIYLVWFGLTRFLTDFIRGDETAAIKFMQTPFTTIQVLAFSAIILGIILYIYRYFKYRNNRKTEVI